MRIDAWTQIGTRASSVSKMMKGFFPVSTTWCVHVPEKRINAFQVENRRVGTRCWLLQDFCHVQGLLSTVATQIVQYKANTNLGRKYTWPQPKQEAFKLVYGEDSIDKSMWTAKRMMEVIRRASNNQEAARHPI